MTKLIDTHFHLDMYRNHKKIFSYLNEKKIYTLCMTNSPGVYISCKNMYSKGKYVRFAMGFHPLNKELREKDIQDFLGLLPNVDYIGEIGLDFSNQKGLSKEIQIKHFDKIISACAKYNKLMSIHIRNAEDEAIRILKMYSPQKCIIHWFTGTEDQLQDLLKLGCYFSVNANMILSNTELVRKIPKEKILIESDGPYSKVNGKRFNPELLQQEYQIISEILNNPCLEQTVYENFKKLLLL